jgi:voltage-gated sodium channel
MAVTMDRVVNGAANSAICANAAVFVWSLADPSHADVADMAEHAITALFVFEFGWRWHAARWRLAFLHGWHLFDMVVIALSLLPMLPGAAVLRLARLARLAKLLHVARHATQLRVLKLAARAT